MSAKTFGEIETTNEIEIEHGLALLTIPKNTSGFIQRRLGANLVEVYLPSLDSTVNIFEQDFREVG